MPSTAIPHEEKQVLLKKKPPDAAACLTDAHQVRPIEFKSRRLDFGNNTSSLDFSRDPFWFGAKV